MSGYVKISRALWDHEAFADGPFSEREAWIWMIAEASWKPRKRRVGDLVVSLERGQLAASVRFMAKAFGWSAAKVQRYLKRLLSLEMIYSETDTGVTIITICNYDDYQSKPKAPDTPPIHQRYTSDTNEKKGEIREEVEDGDGGAGASARDDGPPASPTYRERLLAACGADPVSGLTGQGAAQLGTQAQMIEARRWVTDLGLTEAQVVEHVEATVARKRDGPPRSLGYFTGPMEQLAAEIEVARSRPMNPAPLKAIPGGRHDRAEQRRREDAATREFIRRVGAGEIDLGPDPSDPFGGG